MNDPWIGRILDGRYRVDAPVGRGGMSVVYRGFDLQLRRVIAIKLFENDGGDGQRWESEVRLLARLGHAHLVTLHDAHLEPPAADGPSYLVMEFVPGGDLRERLLADGPSPTLARAVVVQIGEALASVHTAGVVHRDLKPGNILVASSDAASPVRMKLADFGIAHLLGSDRITRTGTMVGTAGYTSPEQVDGRPATPASDVYSLGLVALECLVGRPAFSGTPSESLVARLTRDPVIPAGLDADWAALLASMVAREPSLRPTASDLARRADELRVPVIDTDAPTQAMAPPSTTRQLPPPTLVMPAPPTGHARSRRRPVGAAARSWPLIAAAAALLLALAAGAVALAQGPAADRAPAEGPTSATPTATPSTASASPAPAPAPTSTPPSPPQPPGHGNGKGNGKNPKKG